jgi:hypothetical protein
MDSLPFPPHYPLHPIGTHSTELQIIIFTRQFLNTKVIVHGNEKNK